MPGLRLRSLRLKIIAWSFVPTVVVLAAVASIALFSYQNATQDLVIGKNRELTRLAAGQLSIDIRDIAEPLTTIARTYDLWSGSGDQQQRALENSADRLTTFDGGVVVLDRFGVVTATLPARPDAVGKDWSAHGYFSETTRSTAPSASDIVFDGPSGAPVIAIAVPITSPQGDFLGMMAGTFLLGTEQASPLYRSIARLGTSDSATALLVDGKGRVIFHPDPEPVGRDLSDQTVVSNALSGSVGSSRMRGISGRDVVAGWSAVPGTSWGLIVEDAWEDAISPSQDYSRSLMLLLALGILVPALVVWVGVRRLVQPIHDLIEASRSVATGDFSKRIRANTGDEIEVLANQFNAMADELRASYGQLEERVAARTLELAALNEISAVVNESLNIEEVLGHALEKTLEVTGLTAGTAYKVDSDGDSLILVAHRGIEPEFVYTIADRTSDIESSVLVDGVPRPFALTVAEHTETSVRDVLLQHGLVQIIGVPLTAKGKIVGAIRMGTTQFRPIAPEEKSLLASIGQQVGMAVQNARLHETAEEVATATERNRLARDLHDAVTQTLFSASLIAEVLPTIWNRNADDGRRRLEELRQLTRGALSEMRTLLLELRPATLIETPLGHLVRQLGEATTSRARIPVTVTVKGECVVPPEVHVSLYRVVQEALNNVAKHSGATSSAVLLDCQPGAVSVMITDDGRGFQPDLVGPGHLGVGIMRERSNGIGAEMSIVSGPGLGTAVKVVWRCPAVDAGVLTDQQDPAGKTEGD